jgi:bilirubin oxidase
VDPTLHWANPPGGKMGRDTRPAFNTTPGRYTGPVPMIAHLHGAHTYDWSDGYPEAWYLPAATNIPPGYATTGSFYDFYAGTDSKGFTANTLRNLWGPGVAVFEYPNSQRASTLWYHDHTLGMTRLNVYAGPAGFYLIRGGAADVVIDKKTNTPAQLPIDTREVPLAIQDRSFNADGGLFFPDNRAFFEMLNVPGVTPQQFPGLPELNVPFIGAGACLGASDISPIWNPEFFGNTMVVNGQTWPYMEVQPQRYRFRLLNGCNSRFLILRAVTATDINNPLTWTQVPNAFTQIGSEGGFLPKPVIQNELLIGLAERADTIMDFSAFPPGSTVYLVNVGPDTPFGGGAPGVAFPPADPTTTGQVMQFRVVPLAAPDTTTPPKQYVLPAITPIKANKGAPIRQLSLNELDSATLLVNFDVAGNLVAACNDPLAFPFGPKEAQLGTMMFDPVAGGLMPMAMPWMDPVTEKPGLGVTEVWEIYNFTMDAHPIHLHQTMFQVIDRQNLKVDKAGMTLMPAKLSGAPVPAMPWESGFKDTVIAYPGQVTRLKATFDLPGLYVWHCHIIDHEDNEMMRPLFVGPNIAAYPDKLSMAPMPMP